MPATVQCAVVVPVHSAEASPQSSVRPRRYSANSVRAISPQGHVSPPAVVHCLSRSTGTMPSSSSVRCPKASLPAPSTEGRERTTPVVPVCWGALVVSLPASAVRSGRASCCTPCSVAASGDVTAGSMGKSSSATASPLSSGEGTSSVKLPAAPSSRPRIVAAPEASMPTVIARQRTPPAVVLAKEEKAVFAIVSLPTGSPR
ncbi:hypothetical protein F3Y30_05780 [Sinorhizobium sp. BG8]|nr:hypothetical protein F3Y30_05780 [Sinorhizobium sp. BG8]